MSFNCVKAKLISSLVVKREKEKRAFGLFISAPIPSNTCEPFAEPEEQALPPLQATPFKSKVNNNIEEATIFGKQKFNNVKYIEKNIQATNST